MSPIIIISFFVYFNGMSSACSTTTPPPLPSPSPTTTTEKEVDLLKCKFNGLYRDFKDVKDEIKKLKLKQNIDIKQIRLEKEEDIKQLNDEHDLQIVKLKKNQEKKIQQLENELISLKTSFVQQNISLMTVTRESLKLSTYCELLPSNICSSCTCLDDDMLEERYYCDCQHLTTRRDCLEYYQDGYHVNGIYKIHMNKLKTIQVYCDQKSDGGGWTVFQRRFNGDLNFYQPWRTYKIGFGSLQKDFWLGNDNIHILTLQSAYPSGAEMRIDLRDWNETVLYAKYDSFLLSNEDSNYTLHVQGYTGNCGDSLTYHNGMKFSTYDRDNDVDFRSCSKVFRGAWWYKSCHYSNLNGEYRWKDEDQPDFARCIVWYTYKGYEHSLKSVEIKVRRKVVVDGVK